jgi:WW domain
MPLTFFDPKTGAFADSAQARVRSKLMVNFGNPYKEKRANSLIPEKFLSQAPSTQLGGFGSTASTGPWVSPSSPPHDSFDSVEEGEAIFVLNLPSRKSPKREEVDVPPMPPVISAKRPRSDSDDTADGSLDSTSASKRVMSHTSGTEIRNNKSLSPVIPPPPPPRPPAPKQKTSFRSSSDVSKVQPLRPPAPPSVGPKSNAPPPPPPLLPASTAGIRKGTPIPPASKVSIPAPPKPLPVSQLHTSETSGSMMGDSIHIQHGVTMDDNTKLNVSTTAIVHRTGAEAQPEEVNIEPMDDATIMKKPSLVSEQIALTTTSTFTPNEALEVGPSLPPVTLVLDVESIKPCVELPSGWMCVWSKSQKRWYFFDTKTNKSVWKWPP